MNMHCASRLGWIRSLKEASPHAPEEVTDPAQAGSAASGRAPAGAEARGSRTASSHGATRVMSLDRTTDRVRRGASVRIGNNLQTLSRLHRPKRCGLPLFVVAALLSVSTLVYADVPMASISGPEAVAEGNPAVYTVTLTGGTGSMAVVVDFSLSGTATESDYTVLDLEDDNVDYTAQGGKLTVPAGDPTGRFTIDTEDDEVEEVGEALVVTLTGATTTAGTVTLGSPVEARTTIWASGTKTVTIEETIPQANEEGDPISLTATLSSEATADLTLAYTTANITAMAGSDYIAATPGATMVIRAGELTADFQVATMEDMAEEADETFTVTLTLVNAPDDVALAMSSVTLTIKDDDDLTAKVAPTDSRVIEDSEAIFTVTVGAASVSGDDVVVSSEDVEVSYTVAGSDDGQEVPAEPDDFDPASGKLTIRAGESTGTITIRAIDDGVLERVETMKVTLGDVTTGGRPVTTTGTAKTEIGDRGGTVLVSVSDTTVDEGEVARFTVTLSGEVSTAVEVPYSTADGTAEEDDDSDDREDYEPHDTTDDPIVFKQGETTKTIRVTTYDDTQAEGTETFTVTLGTLTAPAGQTLPPGVSGGTAMATASIRDDDVLTVTVAGPETVPEGSEAVFTLRLAGGVPSRPVEIDYSVSGTATEDVGYKGGLGGTETIPSGTIGTIPIPTVADREVGETLVITLTGARTSGSVVLGTPKVATTTTTGEDTVTVSISVDDGSETVPEDPGGNSQNQASFTVKLTGGTPTEDVAVDYTVHGDVTTADYAASSESPLTIPKDGNGEIKLVLTAANDTLEEGNETFTVSLSLSDRTSDVMIGTRNATATIEDSNSLMASVESNEPTVDEGTEATFTVSLSGATSTADVVVKYSVNGQVDMGDYRAPAGTLTMLEGLSTATVVIPTVDDGVPETDETLELTLGSATTAAGMVDITDLRRRLLSALTTARCSFRCRTRRWTRARWPCSR